MWFILSPLSFGFVLSGQMNLIVVCDIMISYESSLSY
jgi:hypothetical protein